MQKYMYKYVHMGIKAHMNAACVLMNTIDKIGGIILLHMQNSYL